MPDTLRPFTEIFAIAAARKGGAEAFEATLPTPADPAALAALPDDRWLSEISKRVFQAGFNWKVVENKWPGFEEAFWGFDPGRCAMMSDDDLDILLQDKRIIRHATKILSVRDNAIFLRDLAAEHGSAGKAIAEWPPEDFAGLLWMLKGKGSRLGGATGMYVLRFLGVDGFIAGGDALRALQREGVVEGNATSRKDLYKVQEAFNRWRAESGRPMMQISRTLACSVE